MASASSIFAGTESPLREGGVWADLTTYWGGLRKATGAAVVGNGSDAAARYVGVTFSADQGVEYALKVIPTGGQLFYHYLMARMNATAGCYLVSTANDVGATLLQLFKLSNVGGYTQIGTDIDTGVTLAAGHVMRLEVVGTTLTVKLNGTTVRTATDSTWATGQPGIGGWSANSGSNVSFIGDWAAADITAATGAPPIRSHSPNYLHSL